MARMTNAEIIELAAMELSLEVTFDKKNLKDPQSDKELAKLLGAGMERFKAEHIPHALGLVRRMVWGETCRIPLMRVGGPELVPLPAEEDARYRELAAEFGATVSEETIQVQVTFARPESMPLSTEEEGHLRERVAELPNVPEQLIRTLEFGKTRTVAIPHICFTPPPDGTHSWPEYPHWPPYPDQAAGLIEATADANRQ